MEILDAEIEANRTEIENLNQKLSAAEANQNHQQTAEKVQKNTIF